MKTQHQTIINVMNQNVGKWFLPMDFMRFGTPGFVGYEASARLSELARMYPNHVETEQRGKYKARRLVKQIAGLPPKKVLGTTLTEDFWAKKPEPVPLVEKTREAIVAAGGTYSQPALFDMEPGKSQHRMGEWNGIA